MCISEFYCKRYYKDVYSSALIASPEGLAIGGYRDVRLIVIYYIIDA